MTTRPNPRDILDLPLQQNDADASTVRDYLVKLLSGVWEWGEEFDGKRPFGNSSWNHELYLPLVKADLVEGKISDDGYLDDVDDHAADALIAEAIQELAAPKQLPGRLLAGLQEDVRAHDAFAVELGKLIPESYDRDEAFDAIVLRWVRDLISVAAAARRWADGLGGEPDPDYSDAAEVELHKVAKAYRGGDE